MPLSLLFASFILHRAVYFCGFVAVYGRVGLVLDTITGLSNSSRNSGRISASLSGRCGCDAVPLCSLACSSESSFHFLPFVKGRVKRRSIA